MKMKISVGIFLSLLATSALAGGVQASSLSGHYKVIQSDCSPFVLNTNGGFADVVAHASGLSVKSDTGTTVFSFPVGAVKESCLGDCFSIYQSSFVSSNRFHDIRLFAFTDTATPVAAGETDFELNGNQLVITTTDNGQPTPAAPTTCILTK